MGGEGIAVAERVEGLPSEVVDRGHQRLGAIRLPEEGRQPRLRAGSQGQQSRPAHLIDYLDAQPDETTRTQLNTLLAPLDPGIPARAQPVIETGDALVARLRNAGYPDAKADPVDALADATTGEVELAFKLRPGLRASFGNLKISGLGVTQQVVGLADAPGRRFVASLFDAGEIWVIDARDPRAPKVERHRDIGKQPYDGLVTLGWIGQTTEPLRTTWA